MTRKATWFDVILVAVYTLLAACFLYPFWHVLISSFSTEAQLVRGGFMLWPAEPNTEAYRAVLGSPLIVSSYALTIWRTVVGSTLTVACTFAGAYALSNRNLPGRGVVTLFVIITMFFSGGLIPTYLLNKSLGLVGNKWVLVLPGLASAWNVVLARNYLYMQPRELKESAQMDGAGVFQTLLYIIMPLSMPILAVLFLFSAVGHWNAWFDAYIYLYTSKNTVLQMLLRRILFELTVDPSEFLDILVLKAPPAKSVTAATVIVTIGPILILYPFLQKYFVKGIMVGSLKG